MAPLIPDTTSAPAVVAINTMAEPKVALSMDNLDLIDASKFATLPEAVQKALSTLTRLELKRLGASLGAPTKFEILKLPLELREAIYELVLAPITSCQIVNARKKHQKLLEEEDHRYETSECVCTFPSPMVDKLDISLLLTCKQIYSEAINFLHKNGTVKIFRKEWPKSQYYDDNSVKFLEYGLEMDDQLLLKRFRKVCIKVACFKESYIEYGHGEMGTIGRMFSEIAGKIITHFNTNASQSKKEIMFDFVLWHDYYKKVEEKSLQISDTLEDSCWLEKLWLRVHLAEAMKQMRAELDSALGKNIVSLTSNVESNILGLDATRLSATTVRFHHHESEEEGVLTWDIIRYTNFYYDEMEIKLDDDPK